MDPLFDTDSSDYGRPETGAWPEAPIRTMWIPHAGSIRVYVEDGSPVAIEGPFVFEVEVGDVIDLLDAGGNTVFEVTPLVDNYGHDGTPIDQLLRVEEV